MIVERRIAVALIAGVGALAVASMAAAQMSVDKTVVLKDHKFDPAEIHVPSGAPIVLEVDNQDPTPEEFESHELRVEKVIVGNGRGVVRFGPLKPGRYPFYGEYNQATAQGAVVAD